MLKGVKWINLKLWDIVEMELLSFLVSCKLGKEFYIGWFFYVCWCFKICLNICLFIFLFLYIDIKYLFSY